MDILFPFLKKKENKTKKMICVVVILFFIIVFGSLYYFLKQNHSSQNNEFVLCVWEQNDTFHWFKVKTNIEFKDINFHTYELKNKILLKTSWENGQVTLLQKKKEEYKFILQKKRLLVFTHQMKPDPQFHKVRIASQCFDLHPFNAIIKLA